MSHSLSMHAFTFATGIDENDLKEGKERDFIRRIECRSNNFEEIIFITKPKKTPKQGNKTYFSFKIGDRFLAINLVENDFIKASHDSTSFHFNPNKKLLSVWGVLIISSGNSVLTFPVTFIGHHTYYEPALNCDSVRLTFPFDHDVQTLNVQFIRTENPITLFGTSKNLDLLGTIKRNFATTLRFHSYSPNSCSDATIHIITPHTVPIQSNNNSSNVEIEDDNRIQVETQTTTTTTTTVNSQGDNAETNMVNIAFNSLMIVSDEGLGTDFTPHPKSPIAMKPQNKKLRSRTAKLKIINHLKNSPFSELLEPYVHKC